MFVDALDPEIPSLASDAAVELDLIINGVPSGLTAVHQLGAKLNQALEKPAVDQPARCLHVDTAMETILGQAFHRAGDDPTTILSKLLTRTEEAVRQLSSADTGADKTALEWQRAFCLALSQSAAAYRQMLFDVRPPHPFRR